MSGKVLELYWDPGSTNTYFAFKLVPPILRETGATLVLHPFNLGHVFRAHGYALMEETAAKMAYRKRDLQRWADRHGLPFRFPDRFPIKTSRILRGALGMRRWGLEMAYAEAVLEAYWENNNEGIADYTGLRPIAASLGVDPRTFQEASESDEMRQALIDSTDHGLVRGVFGVPTFLVDDELFWGKDRLDFVAEELRRA